MLETGHMLGCTAPSFCDTYMLWECVDRVSIVAQINGFGPVRLDAAEGSIAGDEQEFVNYPEEMWLGSEDVVLIFTFIWKLFLTPSLVLQISTSFHDITHE